MYDFDAFAVAAGADGVVWTLDAYGEPVKSRKEQQRIYLSNAKASSDNIWAGKSNAANPLKRIEKPGSDARKTPYSCANTDGGAG